LSVQGVLFLDGVLRLAIVVILSTKKTMCRNYHIFCTIVLSMLLDTNTLSNNLSIIYQLCANDGF